MSIARKAVRISTATMTALPVNLAGVSTDMPRTAFLSSQFGCLFFFTKFREQRPDRPNDSLMQLLLHLLDDLFAFFTFQLP